MDIKKRIKESRVIFVVPSLQTGGAEKNMIWLTSKVQYSLLIVLTGEPVIDSNYIFLEKKHTFYGYYKLLKLIREIDFKGSLITSLVHLNLYSRLTYNFLPQNCKLITREAAVLKNYYKDFNPLLRYILETLTKISINNCQFIISQSDDMSNDLVSSYNLKPSKIIKISNPINIDVIKEKSIEYVSNINKSNDILNAIFIGRFEKQKNLTDLLEIILSIKRKIVLHLVGYGSEVNSILEFIKFNKIEHKVIYHGKIKNPMPLLNSCDVFLSTSLFEGSPNTFLESLSLGVPIITYDSPGGISELLDNKENCHLININDKVSFIKKIESFHKSKINYDLNDNSEKNCLRLYKNII